MSAEEMGVPNLSGPLFNISAYRVLYILLMLVKHRALTMMQLNEFLGENLLIGRTFNKETITKYIR